MNFSFFGLLHSSVTGAWLTHVQGRGNEMLPLVSTRQKKKLHTVLKNRLTNCHKTSRNFTT